MPARGGLRQLTGTRTCRLASLRTPHGFADPGLHVTTDGRPEIYGTGGACLSFDSWADLLSGHPATTRPVGLVDPAGRSLDVEAWDPLPHRWPDGDDVLYAGVMATRADGRAPRFPQDNWSRRVYAFKRDGALWRREREPLFSPVPATPTYLGHCYGHHVVRDEQGAPWIFYERCSVATLKRGRPFPARTELFARRMLSPFEVEATEHLILGLGEAPYPSTARTIGGHLVEGPRPVRVLVGDRTLYLMGFSSGDFPTDSYALNLAWSDRIQGPYRPLLAPHGRDLLDLGAPLKQAFDLSWGPGRPCLFACPNGEWWMLFHAVHKGDRPGTDYSRWPKRLDGFRRHVYLAPVTIALEDGVPSVAFAPGVLRELDRAV
jgi:hypothetical protein